jgi:hypothetical protein
MVKSVKKGYREEDLVSNHLDSQIYITDIYTEWILFNSFSFDIIYFFILNFNLFSNYFFIHYYYTYNY